MGKSWNDLHKHAQHDQRTHGKWAGNRTVSEAAAAGVTPRQWAKERTKAVRALDRVTVSGAYGRDYKSKKAVMEDWNAYKDFTMRGMRSGYINREDADEGGVEVTIRYDSDRKLVVIKPQQPQSAEERMKAIRSRS